MSKQHKIWCLTIPKCTVKTFILQHHTICSLRFSFSTFRTPVLLSVLLTWLVCILVEFLVFAWPVHSALCLQDSDSSLKITHVRVGWSIWLTYVWALPTVNRYGGTQISFGDPASDYLESIPEMKSLDYVILMTFSLRIKFFFLIRKH